MSVLHKLSRRNLRLNRSRTLVTVIGILLSTALITVVSTMLTCADHTVRLIEMKRTGNYHVELLGNFDENSIQQLRSNREVEELFIAGDVAAAPIEKPKSRYTLYSEVFALSENAFENCFFSKAKEGRLPQNSSEIIIPSDYSAFSDAEYKIGDTITLSMGSLWDKKVSDIYDLPKDAAAVEDYAVKSISYSGRNDVSFVHEFDKAYKIVGTFDRTETNLPSNEMAFLFTACEPGMKKSVIYDESEILLRLKHDGTRYPEFLSGIAGISREEFDRQLDQGGWNDFEMSFKDNPLGITSCSVNESLIGSGEFKVNSAESFALFNIALIIIFVIVISSVMIIRNTFSVSVDSKIRLYGMLGTVGATKRQIRSNVFYEALLLGAAGIPLGVGLGVGVSAVLIKTLNHLLSSAISVEFVFGVSSWGLLAAVILSGLTLFLSALSAAVRASRISPIELVRQNREVKIRRTLSDREYRVPKWVKRVFGAGGTLAWKSLKRSRRMYRTTVISIAVGVAAFISVFSFVQQAESYADFYGNTASFNFTVNHNGGDYDETFAAFDKISRSKLVKSSHYTLSAYSFYDMKLESGTINPELNEHDNELMYQGSPTFDIIAMDDETYKGFIGYLGYTEDELKDKGLIYNQITVYDDDYAENSYIFAQPKGVKLHADYTYETDAGGAYREFDLELAGGYNDNLLYSYFTDHINFLGSGGTILVSRDWFTKHISPESYSAYMEIDTPDGISLEQEISGMNLLNLDVYNSSRRVQTVKSLVLAAKIFIYGFIIVIMLVAATNLFNTISVNMRLRSREFAMLRSVGMTGHEFNRMITLESLFYSAKALLIATPVGLVLGALIEMYFTMFISGSYTIPNPLYNYRFPLTAVLASVAVVTGSVWLIMKLSISKYKKQNIIETIRTENI